MKTIKAVNYNIVFQEDTYFELADFISNSNFSSIFILVDVHTKKYCLPIFNSKINIEYHLITIPAGETQKNLETCTYVWNALADLKADRKSLLINIGGGMLTDIGGFIASTFKRGIRFINVSTSLLGMVDASVGGKTGINFNGLKNQIGLFSNPEMVIIDINYLKTLAKRELHSGMAEIIKYGLSYDENLWKILKNNSNIALNSGLAEVIHRSIEIKNEIVRKDPKEQYLRKILNYGHTIGHAIETFFLQNNTKKTLTHGEAIAVGLVCETYISSVLFDFAVIELQTIKNYILAVFSKIDLETKDFKAILELMKHDKKNIQGEVRFVLLENIGVYKIDCKVSEKLIIESLHYYLA